MFVSAPVFELSRKSSKVGGGRICPPLIGSGSTKAGSNVIDSELTNLMRFRGNRFFSNSVIMRRPQKSSALGLSESKSCNAHFRRAGGVVTNRKFNLDP